MNIFNILTLIGGLSLFLFGMNTMGQSLERCAGGKLSSLLTKLTSNKATGLLMGLSVTAVIQSSSATTVMVVGFVNSGLMTLAQSINVIMGANVGTTVTAWILSLCGIDSSSFFVKLLKPTSFTPILAVIGIIFTMSNKSSKKKDVGNILLGFAVLMFGMDTMSSAVSSLADVPAFRELFILFKNPILGVLAGTILTAIIQSSSASVGILQALAVTGQISYGAAIPIIMGQNIGTCVTALLSAIGANKNAKRAAMIHLSFNVIGAGFWLLVFCIVRAVFSPLILDETATVFGIAVAHTAFNLLCTALLLPMSKLLEKLVIKLVPDSKLPEKTTKLDDRLLNTPSVALERCHALAADMAIASVKALKGGLHSLVKYDSNEAKAIRAYEEKTDKYEDILGTYLVKLSGHQASEEDNIQAAKLLKIIGDFERISDHGVNLLVSAEELKNKKLQMTDDAKKDLSVLSAAVSEILDLTLKAFVDDDLNAAAEVEPLEQVIDRLKEQMRTRHILRLQQGNCSIEAGFVLSDLLTNLERTSDHCSNIAGCEIEMAHNHMNVHKSLRELKSDNPEFKQKYSNYLSKYSLVQAS